MAVRTAGQGNVMPAFRDRPAARAAAVAVPAPYASGNCSGSRASALTALC